MNRTSLTATAIALSALGAFASSLPACGPTQSREGQVPQKTGILSTHNRVYVEAAGERVADVSNPAPPPSAQSSRLDFGIKDCRWNRLTYLGHRQTSAFTQAEAHGTIPSALQTLFLELTALDSSGGVLHRSRIRNPYYTPSPHQGYFVTDCTLQFFIDLPASVDLSRVDSIRVSYPDRPGQVITLRGPFDRVSQATDSEATAHGIPSGTLTAEGLLFDPTHSHGLVSGVDYRAIPLIQTGDPAQRFDLVILGDGFNAHETAIQSAASLRASLFGRKALETAEYLLGIEPYRSMRDRINIWAVGTPSRESGADDPRAGIVRDTFYDSTFNQSCIDRLLGIKNELRALEMASETPFDQSIMIVNTSKYGGAGGVIPTFSTHSSANPVMAHELAHSLGLLSDSYYYFRSTDDSNSTGNADNAAANSCQDSHINENVSYRERRYGGNGLFTEDERLAPNLTRGSSIDTAKWSAMITDLSPIVRTQFSIGTPVRDGNSLTFTYRPTESLSALLLVGGPTGREAAWLETASDIKINGVSKTGPNLRKYSAEDSSGIEGQRIIFYYFSDVRVHAGTEFTVTFDFPTNEAPQIIEGFGRNAHTLTISSRFFDPKKPGLFRGAYPSLTEVWRSSYASRMMVTTHEHDAVEQEALRAAILRYSGLLIP